MRLLTRSNSITILLLSCAIPMYAQVADLNAHIKVKDSIVARFNRKDFQAVYNLSDTAFRKEVNWPRFLDLMQRVSQAGQILSSSPPEDFGDIVYFKVGMPKIEIELQISVTPADRFRIFAINRMTAYDTAYVQSIQTDNALKNYLDSAIDKSVRKHMRNRNVAGLSIGIIRNGQVYKYNYGEMEKGKANLPTSNTFYEIGSITKTFGAIILANAVRDKKLKLEDDARKYLGKPYPNLEFKGQPIQIVHLSNHTSGMPGLPDDFFKAPYDSTNPYFTYTEERMMQALERVKLDTFPGSKFYYSNWSAVILGKILEKAYGMPYQKLVERFITKPMDMRQTKFVLQGNDTLQFATGHTRYGKPTPHWESSVFLASGGLRSTVNDMLKYLSRNIDRKSAAVRLTQELTRGTYGSGHGLNWFIYSTSKGQKYYQHTGGTGGFSTKLVAIPEMETGYIILTNNEIDYGLLSREILYHITKPQP